MSMNGPTGLIFAFGGGLVSFLSPCVLPLVPGYLAFMSGLGAEEVQQRENSRPVVTAAVLFVLGFSLVFVALGATASYIGAIVLVNRVMLTRVAGVFIIIMALVMIGFLRSSIFAMEKRFHLGRELGIWSSFPLGMAFAFGWSPCIGPVLTAIMAAATTEDSVQKGALLLFFYALGLGVPFLAMALFAGRMFESLRWLKRHYQAFNFAGAGILLVMGIFLVMGRWTELLAPVMSWYGDLHLPT
jgi:cytochrome c-type biogenesis protein